MPHQPSAGHLMWVVNWYTASPPSCWSPQVSSQLVHCLNSLLLVTSSQQSTGPLPHQPPAGHFKWVVNLSTASPASPAGLLKWVANWSTASPASCWSPQVSGKLVHYLTSLLLVASSEQSTGTLPRQPPAGHLKWVVNWFTASPASCVSPQVTSQLVHCLTSPLMVTSSQQSTGPLPHQLPAGHFTWVLNWFIASPASCWSPQVSSQLVHCLTSFLLVTSSE